MLDCKTTAYENDKKGKCRYFDHILSGERYEYQRLLLKAQLTAIGDEEGQGIPGDIIDWMEIDYTTAARQSQDRD